MLCHDIGKPAPGATARPDTKDLVGQPLDELATGGVGHKSSQALELTAFASRRVRERLTQQRVGKRNRLLDSRGLIWPGFVWHGFILHGIVRSDVINGGNHHPQHNTWRLGATSTTPPSDSHKDRAVEVLRAIADLLDDVPHVMFCAKDKSGAYLTVNQAFADRAGVRSPDEVVGKHVEDLFDAELAASYAHQDAELWSSRQPLRNQLELIRRPDGSLGWYVTTKVLIAEVDGDAFLASVSVDLRAAGDVPTAHAGVAAAVGYVRAHCTEPVRVGDVAAAASMSVVQLERATRRIVGLSVRQLLVRFRVERAVGLLATTELTLSDVAARCGYYDQSAFTRQFRRVVGVSPGAYRPKALRR